MKITFTVVMFLVFSVLSACSNPSENNYQPTSPSNERASSPPPTTTESSKLTNGDVETAVANMLRDYRLGGSVRVIGIRELPQQNAAIADLQFQQFEYGTTFEGGLLKAKDFKPKAKSGKLIPPPDEMFPQRKAVYSKQGKATLSRYNDGRWALKEVRWGFDTGVKGNVEIR